MKPQLPQLTPAFDLLRQELGRTAVISAEFKKLILAYAAKISEEAYDRGRDSPLNR